MTLQYNKDSEKKSSLSKMRREFLVGEKERLKINEDGLRVAYRAFFKGEAMTGSPVTVIEYKPYDWEYLMRK